MNVNIIAYYLNFLEIQAYLIFIAFIFLKGFLNSYKYFYFIVI